MSPDGKSLRELLADPNLYSDAGDTRAAVGDTWRQTLLMQRPARIRPRVISRARELRRLVLLIGLPMAVAVAVAAFAYLAPQPTVEAPEWLRFSTHWNRGAPALMGRLSSLPGGPYFWLLPLGLSAFLTLFGRGRIHRLLPLDW